LGAARIEHRGAATEGGVGKSYLQRGGVADVFAVLFQWLA
jgi:hypothetical protein